MIFVMALAARPTSAQIAKHPVGKREKATLSTEYPRRRYE